MSKTVHMLQHKVAADEQRSRADRVWEKGQPVRVSHEWRDHKPYVARIVRGHRGIFGRWWVVELECGKLLRVAADRILGPVKGN